MSNLDNLAKFEWENEIPFPVAQVKKTIHAMIGDYDNKHALGLLIFNKKNMEWDLTACDSSNNDAFGSYSFKQFTSIISVTVKEVSEKSTNMKITVSATYGGNQRNLQDKCDKFNKALGYYLEHQDEVDEWHKELPQKIEEYKNAKGCMVILPLIIGGGSMLAWYFM